MQTLKAKVEIKSLDKKISIKRILGNFDGSKNGPTVIFFGGIHGNEKAGIHALINVIQKIEDEGIIIDGNFYAVSGNLNALKNNIRFTVEDLNRIWTDDHLSYIKASGIEFNEDVQEQIALIEIIKKIVSIQSRQ
jgi:succinylglutamate desuccinylase